MTQQELETILLKRQALRDWKEQASAAEIEEFEQCNTEWVKENKLERRREQYYRNKHLDDMDITLLDRENDGCQLDTSKALRIASDLDYLDLIFTRRPEDLHEVVTDDALSAAIKRLTACQKEALFLRMQPHTKTKDLAGDLGSSPRNIRKHLAKARETILKQIGEPQ
ncbi:MAG: hypothetical protein FWC27_07375 [Firmicutes bacterium]|nr:hypothetical protein [Bacillota bacterium]